MSQSLIEALADHAHQQWADWMHYLFDKSTHNPDGSVTIPPDLVRRWKRQMETSYPHLPENEQKSDREEARKIVETLAAYLNLVRQA